MKEQKPKVIIKFEPNPNFEEEFLEFVDEVLSWEGNSNEKAENQQLKNENS